MLSIQLDITGRKIVIVGGGRVATRKATSVLAAGATDVTAIAPNFAEDFPPGVRRIESDYTPEVLPGAFLVFATTDRPTVNDAVVRDARAIGVLVNRADSDDSARGNFTTPAVADFGDVRIAVSTGSAALTAAIRDSVIERSDPRWTALSSAMKTIRPWIVAQKHLTSAKRAQIFRELATDEALEIASRGNDGLLAEWIFEKHSELKPL